MKQLTTLAFFISLCLSLTAQPMKVTVEETTNGGYTLAVNGEPYYIRGAGGDEHLDKLLEIGGNSIRTWSVDDAQEVLDKAHEKGLTVMMGLWVQHERHGFDYNNEAAVAKQLEYFTKMVKKYKDHPALLLWGIGNEVDLFYSNTKVWDAVGDIAKMIHEVDPNHPTTTVTAGLDSMEVQLIKEKAPHLDIYSVNTYGDIGSVPSGIKAYGWDGPFMITEWGPNGHWEVAKAPWGAPIEQTSEEKADSYNMRYETFIKPEVRCLGSYVFLWGQKQETTSTWYGLFSEDGKSAPALDMLQKQWTGEFPAERAVSVDGISFEATAKEDNFLKSEERYTVSVKLSRLGDTNAKLRWEVLPESTDIKAGGDKESRPDKLQGLSMRTKEHSMSFRAPEEEGAYRVFVYIETDDKMSYANIPFYVIPRTQDEGQGRPVKFKEQDMNSFNK